jgi:putative ATP-dependent endonuclease of OLD family
MYVKNLKLWNFRKYGCQEAFDLEKPNLDLNFTKGINVLIGQNDSGKTAIIDSIKYVLKTHSYDWIKITNDDFHFQTSRLRIELIIDDLTEHEAKNFTEWLGWIGEGDESKPYLRLIYDVNRNLEYNYIIPSDVRAGVDDTGYQLTAEAREYLKTTYLKPLRDAKSELIPRKSSRLAQILQGHEAFKGKDQTHLLVGLFKDFNLSIEKYFDGKDNSDVDLTGDDLKGKQLKIEIDKYIKSFYSNSKESNFSVNDGTLKGILEKLELTIKDEINLGLGTLNRLSMASELLHLQKANWNGIRLGLIEELEAHLHPQAQMQVIESLQEQEEIQLILTTHSPNLASKLKLENLIICNDNNAFPMGSDYTKFNPEHYIFLEKFLDTTKANLFFANGVILVEGWSEEILIPSLAKRMGINLTEKGVSVINIGNTGFDNYSRIFLRKEDPKMTIPVSVITDCDIREYEFVMEIIEHNGEDKTVKTLTKRETVAFESETTQKITDLLENSEDSLKYFVAPKWTLEYSLFLSDFISEDFKEIVELSHTGTDWVIDFEKELAKKLINKGLHKTKIAYLLAEKIEESSNVEFNIDDNDAIKYLVDAIKYVCND